MLVLLTEYPCTAFNLVEILSGHLRAFCVSALRPAPVQARLLCLANHREWNIRIFESISLSYINCRDMVKHRIRSVQIFRRGLGCRV